MRWRALKYLTGIALLQAIATACSLINSPEELMGLGGAAGEAPSGGGTSGTGGKNTGGSGGKPGGDGGTGGDAGGGSAGENMGGDGPGTGGRGTGGDGTGGDGTGGDGTGGDGTGGGSECPGLSDPDCECDSGTIVAKDVDDDGEGTRLCEENPGIDCDDGDEDFVQNACGGCNKSLGGVPGEPCLQCGEYQCQGDSSVVCASPSPQPRTCLDGNTPRYCVDGAWVTQPDCTGSYDLCEAGRCVECLQGTFLCGAYSADDTITACGTTGSWESSWFASCLASSSEVCNAATGTCVPSGMLHPRDRDFDVVPLLVPELIPGGLLPEGIAPERGRPTQEVLDAGLASDFG